MTRELGIVLEPNKINAEDELMCIKERRGKKARTGKTRKKGCEISLKENTAS